MSDRLAGRTRWSMAVRCPRMAALALLGAEPEPLTPREEGRFQRGKDAQTFYGRKLVAKYGEENVVHEAPVAWPSEAPIGELHTDFIIKPERMAIETKSSESVDSLFESAVTQVAGAVHWSPDADTGAVVFLDRDYQETDMFPVVLNDELVEKVEDIAAQVVQAGKTGELPERICSKPSDGRGHLCPLIDTCFKGWEPPQIPEADNVEVIAPLATAAFLAKEKYDAAKKVADLAEAEWKEARDLLVEEGCPEGESLVPGLVVKRTVVADRQTFSMAKARTAGLWTSMHDELFHPFISLGGGHSRFSFSRVEGESLEHDFGDDEDVPF